MKTRLFAMGAVLVIASVTGAIQSKQFIGSLRTSDGEYLAEKDGRVVLVRSRNGAVPKFECLQSVWRISAPHLQTAKGKLLAIDQHETGVKIHFAVEKSGATNWVIEVTESTSPQHPNPKKVSGAERQMLVGTAGQKFRLSVFDGRYKGWYLSAEKPTEGQPKPPADEVLVRELQVVKDPKQALLFDYIDTKYDINHK